MKKKIRNLVFVTAVVLVIALVGIYYFVPLSFGNSGNEFQSPESLPLTTVLTKEQVEADRNQMIGYIENIHPYFVVEEDLTEYRTVKETYVTQTQEKMTLGAFQVATGEYLGFFGDGHTVFYWPEEEWLYVPWEYRDGRLYLIQEKAEPAQGQSEEMAKAASGDKKERYVKAIGGIEAEDIVALIMKLFPAENEMAQQKNFENYADGKNLLTYLGAKITEREVVTVELSDGTTQEYTFKAPSGNKEAEDNHWYWEDDIFVVDFNTCVDDANLKQIAKELEAAVTGGTKKVVLDVRGNGGGNSNACERLLSAMGMQAPGYDMLIRYSKEAADQNGYLRKSGSVRYEGSSRCKKNEAVELVVLSDRKTFSSAAMLLVWVRDGGLGTIIGEPSTNRPNHYGDIIYYALENSHIWGTISHKQFVRPDGENKERMLVPDIRTGSEAAYDAAIEYLKK